MFNPSDKSILRVGPQDQAGPSSGYQLRDRDMLCPPQRLRSSMSSYSPLDLHNVPCVDFDHTGGFQPFGSNLCCPGDVTRASYELGPHRHNQGELPNSTVIQVDEPSPIGPSREHYPQNSHKSSCFGAQNRKVTTH